MKKIIFASIAIIAIAGVVALNVNLGAKKSGEISLLALANIEALAYGESGVTWNRVCTYIPISSPGMVVLSCYSCNKYFYNSEALFDSTCDFNF